jgi:hypothetical protein
MGSGSLSTSTTGNGLTAIGFSALQSNTTASNNTAVGSYSLRANTTGTQNIAVGAAEFGVDYGALGYNTTGNNNVAIGMQALLNSTTASNNTAVGYYAGRSNTTGESNVAFGTQALKSNTTASNNTAVGYQAMYSNTTSSNNTAFGHQALYSNVSTSTNNTMLGISAGYYLTSGGNNTFLGMFAGGLSGVNQTATGCTGSVFIGYGASSSNGTASFEIVIGGDYAVGKGANTFFTAATSGAYQGNNSSSWSTTSDQRLKKNIVDNNDGLNKITSIRVRNFEYRLPEEINELSKDQAIQKQGVQLGVIAQELQQILPECVKTESTGVMTVDTDNLTWYLVNAVKELTARIKQLEGN